MYVVNLEESAKDRSKRTFETRLRFIESVFAHKFSEEEIFKKCIQYKLNISYEQYQADINKCFNILMGKVNEDPLKVIKRL